MIANALVQIVDGLNSYLNGIYPATPNQVKITSVKKDATGTDPSSGIDVTLINVEEDKVYKNHLLPLDEPLNPAADKHPLGGISAMRINLYVLFAFHPLNKSSSAYVDSLTRLTHVLQYFQGQQYQQIVIPSAIAGADPITFNLEMNYHNISLEDSNNMWSNLGGEQKPYAMYQIKMLELAPAFNPAPVAVIQTPRISNPTYDSNDKIIYNASGDPANDNNEIQHL